MSLAPVLTTGRGATRDRLFYYRDSELRAVRKGRYKAHFITSGAYGLGEPAGRALAAAAVRPAGGPGRTLRTSPRRTREVVADLVREAEIHRQGVVPSEPLFDARAPATKR